MILLLTGLLACLLPATLSQSDGGGYYPQGQQSGGFFPSPMRGAPYGAPYATATPVASAAPNTPEANSASTGQGIGPSGGGYPGSFFPPTGGAFLGLTPVCAKVAIAITRLHSLLEPIKALVVGAFVFFAIKNFVIPYLVHFSRAFEEEEEDLERSFGKNAPLDPVTLNILRAVSRGVCLERVACQLGKKAKDYPITKEVVRAIDSAGGAEERLLAVFRGAATDDATSCDDYRCNKKRANKKKYKPPSS